MRLPCLLVALVLAPSVLPAQSVQPQGWRVRTDSPAPDSAVSHVRMPPGWHITTGSVGSILYDPANQASGRFAVEAEIFLFPGDNNEGYGVFLGGRTLEEPGGSWTAFLLTRDGSASIERRQGSTSSVLFATTRSAAVKPHTGGDGTAHNIMRVLVQGDSAIFSANGQRITAIHAGGMSMDGIFGFRVGKGTNLHISNLDLVNRLAPFPVRR